MNVITSIAFCCIAIVGCSSKERQTQSPQPHVLPPPAGSFYLRPSESDTNATLVLYLRGPAPEHDFISARERAMAIDILARRKARETIPDLIECLTDGRALQGSDNWVGGHAANALTIITGRPFSINKVEWQKWWAEQTDSR